MFQAVNQQNCNTESPQFIGVELAEALEENDMYKVQLKRWVQVVDFLIHNIELFDFLNLTSEIGYMVFTF